MHSVVCISSHSRNDDTTQFITWKTGHRTRHDIQLSTTGLHISYTNSYFTCTLQCREYGKIGGFVLVLEYSIQGQCYMYPMRKRRANSNGNHSLISTTRWGNQWRRYYKNNSSNRLYAWRAGWHNGLCMCKRWRWGIGGKGKCYLCRSFASERASG